MYEQKSNKYKVFFWNSCCCNRGHQYFHALLKQTEEDVSMATMLSSSRSNNDEHQQLHLPEMMDFWFFLHLIGHFSSQEGAAEPVVNRLRCVGQVNSQVSGRWVLGFRRLKAAAAPWKSSLSVTWESRAVMRGRWLSPESGKNGTAPAYTDETWRCRQRAAVGKTVTKPTEQAAGLHLAAGVFSSFLVTPCLKPLAVTSRGCWVTWHQLMAGTEQMWVFTEVQSLRRTEGFLSNEKPILFLNLDSSLLLKWRTEPSLTETLRASTAAHCS